MTIARCISFDFDGVVVDSLDAHRSTYATLFKLFGRPFPGDTVEGFRAWYTSRWENNFLHAGFSAAELQICMQRYEEIFSYRLVKLFPGIAELIRELSQSVPLVVVSTTKRPMIEQKLGEASLVQYFSAIEGWDGTSDKVQKLTRALKHVSLDPHEVIHVGDTSVDIAGAKSVGMRAVGVTYGWYSEERVRAEKPDFVAHNVAELGTILRAAIAAK